jgi:NAD(P)-dependent dehydrogenase (short-subunit alcohol dehydrogenase family)
MSNRQRPLDADFRMPSFRLDGRVALVTGGSRGLGLAMTLALAEHGADVALVARGADVQAAAEAVRARGRRALAIATDIGSRGAPDLLVERTTNELGGLDILVNGAGINVRKPAASVTREDFEALMRINLEAAFFISQAAGRVMRVNGWGRILCIGSIAAEVAIPNLGIYAMSKGGLRQMVKSLALEWAKDGVTVNGLAPGRFWTKMTDQVFSDDRLHDSAVRVIPMGRPGVPSDLAGATVLLASDAGSYITGQTIAIDGGWLASGGVDG